MSHRASDPMRPIPVMGAEKEENLVLPNVGGTVMGMPYVISHQP